MLLRQSSTSVLEYLFSIPKGFKNFYPKNAKTKSSESDTSKKSDQNENAEANKHNAGGSGGDKKPEIPDYGWLKTILGVTGLVGMGLLLYDELGKAAVGR